MSMGWVLDGEGRALPRSLGEDEVPTREGSGWARLGPHKLRGARVIGVYAKDSVCPTLGGVCEDFPPNCIALFPVV